MSENKKSLFRKALEMSKEDAKAAGIDLAEDRVIEDCNRLIKDKQYEVRGMELSLNELLGLENLKNCNGKDLLEKVASKKGDLTVAKKRLEILELTFSEIFEG